MASRRDDRESRGDRPRTAPPRNRRQEERRSDRGSQRGSEASYVSGGSRGSYTERRPPNEPSRNQERRRPKSQDGGSSRGGYSDGRRNIVSIAANPIHENARDLNQFAMNSSPHQGGRLPNGRLLAGVVPDGMLYHPRSGYSRTQFGGLWEDHKTEDRAWPPQSNTKSGFSDFDANEPTECSTYQHHFGLTFDGADTMGQYKPNATGTSTALRGVNGYGRSKNGGYFMREKLGELKRYKHEDSWRAMPSWARGMPEPTRPGPGYTRTDQGGYFRT